MDRQNTVISQELGRGRVKVHFLFKGNGSSDVDLTTVVGVTAHASTASNTKPFVASITHSATGVLLVTLNDTFNKLLYADVRVVDDGTTPDAARATVSNISNEASSSAVTFKINYWKDDAVSGIPTATDPPAGRVLMVELVIRNATSD